MKRLRSISGKVNLTNAIAVSSSDVYADFLSTWETPCSLGFLHGFCQVSLRHNAGSGRMIWDILRKSELVLRV